MWETWVWSLGWEGSLEEGMETHSSILAWRIPMDREAWQATVRGVAQSQTRLSNYSHISLHIEYILKSKRAEEEMESDVIIYVIYKL